jgi:hypothetical protein
MLTHTPAPAQGDPAPPLSCERLRAAPAVFALVTGLTPDVFDALLGDLGPRYEDAEDARLARPNRKHARGAGRRFALSLPDRVLVALLHLRYRSLDWFMAFFFGVSELTAWRTRRRLVPLLRASRHIDRALRRRRLTRRLAYRAARQAPELRVFLNTFAMWARDLQGPLLAVTTLQAAEQGRCSGTEK